MWLSSQSRKAQRSGQGAETGVVTLEGEKTAVYLTGERRNLPVLSPGGYCWRPAEILATNSCGVTPCFFAAIMIGAP